MKIQVHINEEGALRNQRYAFTDRFTLVSELLQNARRAGALHIVIDHQVDKQMLRVQDDGLGIEDFQKLLSFHESGWDGDTIAQEHPFGIGFTKCLYAAARVVVLSGDRCVDIDTVAALRREAFEVQTATQAISGTVIELHGVDIADLAQRMEELCEGFPVDVVFNGQSLERRYAEDRLPFMATPIGAVHVAGNRSGKAARNSLVFLQGFCVKRPTYYSAGEINVVHLDPQQFMARLPDRDTLIDADQQLRRVEAQFKQSWRTVLEVARTQLPAVEFVDTYFDAMKQWGHVDLLNDLDVLPAALFERIVGYPIQARHAERDYVEPVASAPSREDIEEGRVTVVSLGWPDGENTGHWMLARHKQWLAAEAYVLDPGHWLQPHVRYIEDQEAQIEVRSETARATLEGRWVNPLVIVCESVHIRVGVHKVDVGNEGVCLDGDILVPAGENSGEPVRQLSDFVDGNDRYREDEMEADRDALADLIRLLRSTDPVDTLSSLLADLHLGKYPLLHGRQFEVTVGQGSMPGCTVELLGSTEAVAMPGGDGHAER
ncbi:MAG TPA: ATP-binding protein [Comamonadaceae bacterium]|uniref:ATP-binding protein n=1 Tax=Acidovorax sp. 210-6 TaxID=2699468 RepID=UPI0008D159C5|nr:ATP-binding protein [Acidovorax sp. 210-6]MCL4768734.1 ATP-binding protein [Burkholderiaceae bacterium]NCU66914.1 ATP-binding protein [Acidovorax sp. 210-6]OGB45612.1 MAG: ATPase [Burkholderiales bacterium RIFCSPLOWO2_12_FULL_65_40]HCE27661.1 ATP-binding protein [Comamonadaceae bacterium]